MGVGVREGDAPLPPSPLGRGVISSKFCMGGGWSLVSLIGGALTDVMIGLRLLRLVLSLSRKLWTSSSPLSVKVSLSPVSSFEGLGVGEKKPPRLGEAGLGGICVSVACASDTYRGGELGGGDVVVDRMGAAGGREQFERAHS